VNVATESLRDASLDAEASRKQAPYVSLLPEVSQAMQEENGFVEH
jgi:hypothetical protein